MGEFVHSNDNPIPTVQTFDNLNSAIPANSESGTVTFTLGKFLYRKSLCRVCLLEKEDIQNILDNNSKSRTNFNIVQVLKTLLNIDITPGDGLPDQICTSCLDTLLDFSVFRKTTFLGQTKLQLIINQVEGTSNPTFIQALGEQDLVNSQIYKYSSSITSAQQILKSSTCCHLVMRNISDRVWDRIFEVFSTIFGNNSIVKHKSGLKLKKLSTYVCDKPYVIGCLCTGCNEFIHGSLENFAKHRQDVHLENDSITVAYPCDICGSLFPMKGPSETYVFHWLKHFYMNPCDLCDKYFPSLRSLSSHKISSHPANACPEVLTANAKLEVCHTCGKEMTTSSSSHMKKFHPSQHHDWQCEVCSETFGRKPDLDAHAQSVHLNPNVRKFQCEICGETFKFRVSRDAHVLKHRGERPYSCETCGKRFFSKNSLRSHAVQHKGKTFHCPEPGCGKSFKRKLYLKEHLRVHSGDKPYHCDICGISIRMKSNFYKHMKIHKREKELQKLPVVSVSSNL